MVNDGDLRFDGLGDDIKGGKLMIRFHKVLRSYWRRYDFMWVLPRGTQYVISFIEPKRSTDNVIEACQAAAKPY